MWEEAVGDRLQETVLCNGATVSWSVQTVSFPVQGSSRVPWPQGRKLWKEFRPSEGSLVFVNPKARGCLDY